MHISTKHTSVIQEEELTEKEKQLKGQVDYLTACVDVLMEKVETLTKRDKVREDREKEDEHKFRQMEERLCQMEKEKNEVREKTVAEKNCEVAELEANCTEWKAQCRENETTIYNLKAEKRELKEALSTAMDTIDEQKHKIRELEWGKCKANLKLKHFQEEVPIKQVLCNTANKVKTAVGRVTQRQMVSLTIPVQATD